MGNEEKSRVKIWKIFVKVGMKIGKFLRYAIVGGMPTAALAFLAKKDIRLVQKIQRELITDYKADMVKYAESTRVPSMKT